MALYHVTHVILLAGGILIGALAPGWALNGPQLLLASPALSAWAASI